MRKTYKFRIYPTSGQRTTLIQFLDLYRWVYNELVGQRKARWEQEKQPVGLYEQQVYTKNVLALQNQQILELHAQSLQQVAVRVDLAFKAFFRRVKAGEKPGYPRFKGKGGYDSFTYPQNNGAFRFLDNGTIRLSKIGYVKVVKHREIEGTPKTCTVRRTSTGKWFIMISCDDVPPTSVPDYGTEVGIDLGISSFLTCSDGDRIENPRFFKKEENNLARAQRKVMTNFSKKRKKTASLIHERIKNKRDDFLHKLSREVIRIFKVICVEDLKVNQMIRSGKRIHLSKSIQDVAWGNFLSFLSNKAESAGRILVKVNPAFTSQDCSGCGDRQKIDLSTRTYCCRSCGLEVDRDLNAARNILAVGLYSLTSRGNSEA